MKLRRIISTIIITFLASISLLSSDISYSHSEDYCYYNWCPEDTIPTPPTWGGIGPICTWLDKSVFSWSTVEVSCSWNHKVKWFKLDCWNGEIFTWKADSNNKYTGYCKYSEEKTYNAVCYTSWNPTLPLENASNWKTRNACEDDIEKKLEEHTITSIIIATTWDDDNEIPEENDDWWNSIKDTFDDYTDKVDELKDIVKKEKVEAVTELKSLPDTLLAVWTPVEEKTSIINDPRVETLAPEMTKSFTNDIKHWKAQLPEIDRARSEYIVIPSSWLVVPVNYVPQNSDDYKDLVNWKNIDVNEHLKTWVMNYPSTKSTYWEAWNKVIYGHSSYWKIDEGRYKTQFQKIIELDEWEEIWVYKLREDGSHERFVYIVNKSFETSADNVSVLNQWIWSNLTLITCTPIGWITARWVVKAKYLDEKKAPLQDTVYWNNVSKKYKQEISTYIDELETFDINKRAITTLKLFSRIENLQKKSDLTKKESALLQHFKTQLSISYNSISK